MKIVPPEPAVDLYNDRFEKSDILQRKKTGAALSDLVNRIDDPLVVALDGRWGTGKTYFLKRWVGEHKEATTIYFDAFAHDYISDPLPALISALAERTPPGDAEALEAVKNVAFKLARPAARVALAAATYGATELLSGLGHAVAESLASEADAGLQKYWALEADRRTAMADFKEAIEAFAHPEEEGHTGATLVFVIDELDRCRPDYALEVLEVIKHLFMVQHLHFVLGVNLEALEDMVHTRYGPNIDAHGYLGKFIQVRLELPDEVNDGSRKKNVLAYLDHVVGQMEIPDQISGPLRQEVEIVARANQVSLRDIGSIVSSVALASGEMIQASRNGTLLRGWTDVMNTLIVSRTVRPDLYPKFLEATLTPDDLKSYLGTGEGELRRILGANFNPDHNLEVSIRYHSWLYISQDPSINQYKPDFLDTIAKGFGDFGRRISPKDIPVTAHRQFLDRFSFYTPHQP